MQPPLIVQEFLAGLLAITTLMAPITMNHTMFSVASIDAVAAVEKRADIEVKLNGTPKKHYALAISFSDLPGSISGLSATADYVVDNVECVAPQQISGARLRPEHNLPLTLQRVDNNRYITKIQIDALQDEDYFDLGECHWALNWATIRFASNTTKFVGAIPIDQIQAGAPVELHYLVSDFGKKTEPDASVFGEETDIFSAEAGPRFTLTLTATEAGK
jgi:hypothetical protein